jgi:hypothetical protein
MVKLTREERALKTIEDAWSESTATKTRRGGYSKKANRKRIKANDKLWTNLLKVAAANNIFVKMFDEKDRVEKHRYRLQGTEFAASGYFRAPNLIKLRYQSSETLAHELGHALDYQLGDNYCGSETVATAVATLLCGTQLASYSNNAQYAQKQGFTKATLNRDLERATLIYEVILESM